MVTVSLHEKNGKYHAVINYKDDTGKRKQKWQSTHLPVKGNKKLAMQKAEQMRKEFEQELELKNTNNKDNEVIKGILFVDYMKNWLKIIKPTIELNTYGSYEQMVNYRINNYFTANKIRLKELQPINIQDFYTYLLNDGLSSNTVIHYHAIICLKWNAINFENNSITIKHTIVQVSIKGERQVFGKDRTKNKTSYRTLPLVPEVAEILKRFKQIQENNKKLCKNDYIAKYEEYICVDSLGNIIKPDFITKHFKRLLKNNNLRIIRFHDLRHSCASLLLARGIQLKEIQEWLRHSNFNTTANIYAHLDTKVKQKSADVLSNILKGQKNISNCDELDIEIG